MLEEYLIGYDDSDYVYIIDGCMDLYVSSEPLDDEAGPCPVCGDYDWPYLEGYVYDIRSALDEDDFYRISSKRELRERLIQVRNTISNKTYNELLNEFEKIMYEKPKQKILWKER